MIRTYEFCSLMFSIHVFIIPFSCVVSNASLTGQLFFSCGFVVRILLAKSTDFTCLTVWPDKSRFADAFITSNRVLALGSILAWFLCCALVDIYQE